MPVNDTVTLRFGTMDAYRELVDAWTSRMRGQLDPGEELLAMVRCEDISAWGGIERGGIGRCYLIVTTRQLLLLPHLDLRFEASVYLDDVTAVTERTLGHRCAITMQHAPLARLHTELRQLYPLAIPGDLTRSPLDRTTLALSRRETEAAATLREQLAARGSVRTPTP